MSEPNQAAQALLNSLNELFVHPWQMRLDGDFYQYELAIDDFCYVRRIQARHIDQPFRTAFRWSEEVCERYGHSKLIRHD